MRPFSTTLILIGLCSLAGCGDGAAFKTAPVSGTVMIDGVPVEDAEVHFIGVGMNAVGKTDSQGKYELERGAVVGENQVYISKYVGGVGGEQGEIDAGQMEAMAIAQGGTRNAPKQLIPARYSNPASMSLTLTIPSEGISSADFDLSSK